MLSAIRLDPIGRPDLGLVGVIDAVGEGSFGDRLLGYLRGVCGAEHLAVVRLDDDKPSLFAIEGSRAEVIGSLFKLYLDRYWRTDPLYPLVHRASRDARPSLFQMDASVSESDVYEQLYLPIPCCDRTVISGNAAGSRISLSMIRPTSRGPLADETVDRISGAASLILSLIGKHEKIVSRRFDASRALASLESIEDCILGGGASLPRRETQVCARILYGVTSAGIAVDLGVSEETVTTYRKRIYQRLGIGSQHELLRWYLAQWSGPCATAH